MFHWSALQTARLTRASTKAISRSKQVYAAVLAALLLACTACRDSGGLPKPDSKEYRDLVTAFYVGLAGLQTGEDVYAKDKLTLATQIAPGEPAAWANLGLLAVRQQEFDAAYEKVERARALAPDNSQIAALLGFIESKRGKLPEAIAHLNKAVALDAKNLKALYALAQETERQSAETSDAEAQKLLAKILEIQPDNLAVLLDVARLAAKRGDGAAVQQGVVRLAAQSASWPDAAKQQMAALQQTATSADLRAVASQAAFLRNVLLRVPAYRQSMNAVKTPAEYVGEPFLKFLKLPSPSSQPAPPDTALSFVVEPFPNKDELQPIPFAAVPFDAESKPALLSISYKPEGIQIAGGALIPVRTLQSAWGLEALDFNYDFKTDIVVVSRAGVRFYRQQTISNFADVTATTKLPSNVLTGEYLNVQSLDFDLDGDLDLLLFPFSDPAPMSSLTLLRNNGDGTFKEMLPFPDLKASSIVSADLDGDGDPDLTFVENYKLRVFTNDRLGQYRERAVALTLGAVEAFATADLNSDGKLDLVVLNRDGQILRVSDKDGNTWELAEVARVGRGKRVSEHSPAISLQLADFDNNGGLDIVADGGYVLLSDAQGKFVPVNVPADIQVSTLYDVSNDGRLDLIGIQRGEKVVQLINRGTKNYNYQFIRTRAAHTLGDQRMNSFGIGGEIEIRCGLLTQKQVINSPLLHFGLGEHSQTDVARIVWPNGILQSEFDLKAGQSILANQRLKGSCPSLFAWDGQRMSFVKDTAPLSTGLGLPLDAQTVARIYQTEEWFKLPGDRVRPRADAAGSYYDLRVTAELWETYYIDHYSLLVVDHPPGTAVFTDERVAVPPPKLKLYAVKEPRPFASARDDRGQDLTRVVSQLDEQYLDTFGRGPYQGVTRDHWVELELSADAPRDKPLYLIGHGWLRPPDGTVNIAISQGKLPAPQGLSIEVPDARGNWVVAKSGLGFLASKFKTMVIDLDGVFRPGAPRRLRLRTNLEIYWDKLEWAEALPAGALKVQRLAAAQADLRYRGFSVFTQANASAPAVPDYHRLAGTAQRWRDLEGYYTRHGDVRELLTQIDDRMVIVNAGDEIRLRFAALPAPAAGWVRDFVMVGDGWIKEGDHNTTFSQTVLPLPYHGLKDYNVPPKNLEDDPAYRKHPRDWQEYHTRYVTPESFLKAIR
jgi:Tfp pilus assembly protein PilF